MYLHTHYFMDLRRPASRLEIVTVQGLVVKTTRHITVSCGSADGRKRHPWTVLCEYRYEGQTYTVRSTFLWDEPVGSTAKIFLDQERPGQAWVDPRSLQNEIKLR